MLAGYVPCTASSFRNGTSGKAGDRLKGGGSVLPGKYNELWRYGAGIEDVKEEQSEEKTLVRIAEWLLQRI